MCSDLKSLVAALAILFLGAVAAPVAAQETRITVFAAASLKNALDEVDAAYTRDSRVRVVVSYAATSALMKQIEQGAPADLFASADLEWMDYGTQKGLVRAETRVNLLGNTLVLIAPKDSKIGAVAIRPGLDLAALVGDGRVVTADVRSVPVGKYAKAALEALGAWTAVEKKLAFAENVRVALILVARGEAPLGIVYATDAKAEPNVKVVGVFPEESHPAIVYPVALTAAARPQAAAYLQFLRSPAAKEIFERHGFVFLAKPSS